MKKILIYVLCIFLLAFSSCATNNSGLNSGDKNKPTNNLLSLEEIMEKTDAKDLTLSSFDLDKYVTPYWESQIIYNETVCFYEKNGVVQDKKLVYNPAKILEVRNYGLDVKYEEGKDYVMTKNGIAFVDGSSIPTTNFDYFYLDTPFDSNAAFRSISHPDKFVAYNEFQYFTNKQICVTYVRTEEYDGPKVKYETKLDKLTERLINRENLTFLFYGDSIMEGCNASLFRGNNPLMPKFSELVVQKLSNYYGYNGKTTITHKNTAVGGWLSSTGVEQWQKKNGDITADCLVLNFGCNDGTFTASPDSVLNNLRIMISKVKEKNPDCAIIVISPFIPNKDAKTSESESIVRNFYNNQDEYEEYFEGLVEEYEDAVCVKITSIYDWILTKKQFIDICASNVSHPNDYFIRFYAQAILTKLINGEF